MSAWSLSERTVKVIADRGEGTRDRRFVHGSGCLIGGTTVLTAAHILQGAHRVTVRRPDLAEFSATVCLAGDPKPWRVGRSPGADLALLTVPKAADWQVPSMECARVNRGHTNGLLERARAVGYPQFAARAQSLSGTIPENHPRRVWLQVPVAGSVLLSSREDGLLDLQVTIEPAGLTDRRSCWAGMSGAPVTVGGRLIGVVNEHAPRYGSSTLAIVPLTALEETKHPRWSGSTREADAWRSHLGLAWDDLLVVPPPVEAPYWATVREIGFGLHQRMPRLVGREQELALLSEFATGPPGYQWWKGGVYAGKSAMLYELVTSGALPDDVGAEDVNIFGSVADGVR